LKDDEIVDVCMYVYMYIRGQEYIHPGDR